MILRKPYAFFIKHFRLFHVILAVLVYYSIYFNKKLLDFFNEYSSEIINVVGQNLAEKLMPTMFKILPILIIIILGIILGVMFNKKKPLMFYVVNLGIYIYLFVVVQISNSTLNAMSESLLAPRTILLVKDLIMFSFLFQVGSAIFITIRATGFDFKKFDFKKDIQQLDISEEDREEIEVEFKFDRNEIIRTIRKFKRNAKYIYQENKLFSNIGISVASLLFVFLIISSIKNRDIVVKQNVEFDMAGFNASVTNSYLVNTDYKGNKITDDYYLILRLKIKSDFVSNVLDMATTEILINDYVYTPVQENLSKLFDFGKAYRGEVIGLEYEEKVLIYHIPKQLIDEDILFSFVDLGDYDNGSYRSTKVKIKYEDLTGTASTEIINLNNEVQFDNSILSDYKVNIAAFDIQKQYKLNYEFCVSNECIPSIEYIKPNINSNYDKAILKIKGTIEKGNSISEIADLYDFIEKFGKLQYTIGGNKKNQNFNFSELTSKKTKEEDTYYIEVLDELLEAENISIIFTLRNRNYEYILK